jgi:hypothetical protein
MLNYRDEINEIGKDVIMATCNAIIFFEKMKRASQDMQIENETNIEYKKAVLELRIDKDRVLIIALSKLINQIYIDTILDIKEKYNP